MGRRRILLAAFAVLSVVALAGFDLQPSHGVCDASLTEELARDVKKQ